MFTFFEIPLKLTMGLNKIWFTWFFLRLYQSKTHTLTIFNSNTPMEINTVWEKIIKILSVIDGSRGFSGHKKP